MLEIVGLENNKKKKVKKFSLGMKQRLGIAIALLNNPDLVVLDEPINALDPVGIMEMRNLFKQIKEEQGTSFLISSHNLSELYHVADNYIIIDNGNIKKQVSQNEIEREMKNILKIKSSFIRKIEKLMADKFPSIFYELVGEDKLNIFCDVQTAEKILIELQQNNILLSNISNEQTTLEDYYLDIIRGENNICKN